jgi:hypothetical protein
VPTTAGGRSNSLDLEVPILNVTRNGNHAYQFYAGGVRPLNDGNAKNNFKLTSWLGWSTVGLTCANDCHGFIKNSEWCQTSCQSSKRHVSPKKGTFSSRRSAPRYLQRRTKDKCGISYDFPGYPETTKGDGGEKSNSAGTFSDITSNGWWSAIDQPFQSGMCHRKLQKPTTRTPGTQYATEHIYEKQIVTAYLNWLTFDFTEENGGFNAGHIADCPTMRLVFNRRSTTPGSQFSGTTPAQALANAMSCFGKGCPATDRQSEFYILQSDINGLKAIVLGQMRADADFRLLNCKEDVSWEKNRAKLYTLSTVFQYMSDPDVAAVFVKVNARVRSVLEALDDDTFYDAHTPQPLNVPDNDDTVQHLQHNGWLGAYDYFMRMFLFQAQEKSRQFAYSCMNDVIAQIQGDDALSDDEKKQQAAMLAANRQSASGMWSDATLTFGSGFMGLMGSEWS